MASIKMTNNTLMYNRTLVNSLTITENKNKTYKISVFPVSGGVKRLKNVKEVKYNGPAFTVHSIEKRTQVVYRTVKNKKGHYINFYKIAPKLKKIK